MTDIQIQNQTSNLNTSKKEFENRYDDKALRNLCVKNIPKETKENELLDLFKQFGSIESIKLKVNKNVGPYAIYAYVLFSTPEEAKRCLKQMNGKILKGRALRIDFKRYNNKNDDDESNIFNNYNNNNNNGNNNSSNKYHRKINRNNQFHNNRYPNNNKRIGRNDVSLNDDNNNVNDSETNNFRDYEQINKRPRIGIMNENINNGNRNMNNNINYNSVSNINNNLDFNKLLKDYGEKKLLNNFNNEDKNNEIESIIQTLIKDMIGKSSRVKLYLCDHLRQCAQHVFNRPIANQHIINNNVNNNGIDVNTNIFNVNNPLYNQQDHQNISNLNSLNLNETNNFNMNNDINNKEIAIYSNSNIPNNNIILNNDISNNMKKFIWKGSLEMRNKENLKIIGYALQGNVNDFLSNKITNIVISHRKRMKSIPKIEAAYYFEIENEQDENIFNSYKNYFNSKDRVGLASTDEDWHIYIIFPGSPIFNEFFNNNLNNIFIGVVCYNPQYIDKKITPPLMMQNLESMNNLNQNNLGNLSKNIMNNNITSSNLKLNNNVNNTNIVENNMINIYNDMLKGKENNFNTTNSHFYNNPMNLNSITGDQDNINSHNALKNQNNKNDYSNQASILNQQVLQKNNSQNNDMTFINDSLNNSNEVNNKEDNKNDIPNWLNQFSSLAAYLVKK
ncbi:RNA-binding protein, putative [Plasmodium relictum]|uniref:RNA-binding protein, putative n=1 Tax=Plasmodium relictum TaxID=85471 RepID=A0A1J1HDG9_PLARL|nr:RNA-binding protein, putative [Plasmodium relictum]CRH01469.1 RNA-binding protein, putative [Plasmodium relictum]